MGKNSGPPKCKTCSKEEWRHTCGPTISPKVLDELKPKPKTDRKEYLKLKARERRVRQKLEGK